MLTVLHVMGPVAESIPAFGGLQLNRSEGLVLLYVEACTVKVVPFTMETVPLKAEAA